MANWKRFFIRPESEAIGSEDFVGRDTRLIEIIDRAVAIVAEVTTQPIDIKREWVGDILLEAGYKPADLETLCARAITQIEERLAVRRKEVSGVEDEIRERKTRLAFLRDQISKDDARRKNLETNVSKVAVIFDNKIER